MPLYQSTRRFFAACSSDLEEALASELVELGATDPQITRRGVHFVADDRVLYRAVLECSIASRLLAPLSSFDCHSAKYLHRRVEDLPWEELLDPDRTILVSATLANSRLNHTQYAAQVVKDGICDRFRRLAGRRPNVDKRNPDLRVHLHAQGNKATLSVDCADGAMHRRGYRLATGEAPIAETVAAAILHHAQWRGQKPLLDPFCGSGTFLAEAAFRATGVGVGSLRPHFGVRALPDFDAKLFATLLQQHRDAAPELESGLLRGADRDPKMVEIARENLERVPGGEDVLLRRTDVREHPGLENGLVVCNPPYGIRMGRPEEAAALMAELGDFLKQRCKGSTAWIYLGDRELAKSIGLRPAQRIPMRSGGLDGRLLRYDLY
jgi:23S rRNA (guanine2445-N2)-methyltransferase